MDMNTQGQPQTPSRNSQGERGSGSPAPSPNVHTGSPRSSHQSVSSEGERPPLPPRPNTLNLLDEGASPPGAIRQAAQPNLQASPTTAVSRTDIGFQQSLDGATEPPQSLAVSPSTLALRAKASLGQLASPRGSETGDSASIRSYIPNVDAGEVEDVFGDFTAQPAGAPQSSSGLLQLPEFHANDVDDDFAGEFEPVGEVEEGGQNEGLSYRTASCLG